MLVWLQGRFWIVLAVVGVLFGAGLGMMQRQSPPVPTVFSPSPPGVVNVEVHVVGWVMAPGVVSIPAGSLVVDAVLAAGGLRPGALVEAVNLAASVSGGQQIVVPGPDASIPGAGPAAPGLVNINSAPASELESLPGVGPVLAGRIVAYRDQHGPFSTVEDLLGVSGIGEAKLASLRDLIVVQ